MVARENSRSGFSLGTALLVVTIIALLGVTVCSLAISHQGFFQRSGNSLKARNAARSVVEQAIAKIFEGNLAAGETFTIDEGGVSAELTFDPTEAQRRGLRLSVDNLVGTTSVSLPDGSALSAATARLTGRASFRGLTREVEVLLYVPPYPYALASAGPIEAPSGLVVGELFDYNITQPVEDLKLAPADLGSDSPSTQAVVLGGQSRISGNVETPGDIVTADTVVVEGELRSGFGEVTVPTIDPRAYDPIARGLAWTPLPAPGTPLTRTHREPSTVVVDELQLLNGFLFVDGDLIVNNGLVGQGVVVTTGALTVNGGTALNAAGLDLALVAGQKVTLTGAGPENTAFHGVVYAGGGLEARRVSVVGTLIADSPAAPVFLDEVAVLEKPGEAGPRAGVAVGTPSGPIRLGSWGDWEQAPFADQDARLEGLLREGASDPILEFTVTPRVTSSGYDFDFVLLVLPGGHGAGSQWTGTGSAGLNQAVNIGVSCLARSMVGGADKGVFNGVTASLDNTARNAPLGEGPEVNPALILGDLSRVLRLADRTRILRWQEQ